MIYCRRPSMLGKVVVIVSSSLYAVHNVIARIKAQLKLTAIIFWALFSLPN